jgi:neuropeptide S receptor 1
MVTYASTYVLVALSIDRWDAISHPMNFSGSCKKIEYPEKFFFNICLFFINKGKRAKRLVLGAWILSAIFSAPLFILYEEKIVQGKL